MNGPFKASCSWSVCGATLDKAAGAGGGGGPRVWVDLFIGIFQQGGGNGYTIRRSQLLPVINFNFKLNFVPGLQCWIS